MNLTNRLEQFRTDNPYDAQTQSKRLLASNDKELILYVLQLGFALAKQRQRHDDRQYIKNTGHANAKEKMTISRGRVTGSVVIKPSRKTFNAMQKLIVDVWTINGEQKLGDATAANLGEAVQREMISSDGHRKNAEFYNILRKPLMGTSQIVRDQWTDETMRPEIERVYGEFRKSEAA